MRYVLLTSDYEIFGNGAGDVRQHMVDPTERMARICEKYHAPLTLFVEMEETLAFERHAVSLKTQLGYDPYRLVRDQVVDLVRRGHDAQLHLHPEWYGASLLDGRWQLDFSKATVDSLFESAEESSRFIALRKAALEEFIGAAGSRQRVTCYRAGAFSAQPGARLIHALVQNGFKLDSSVVHGLTRKGPHVSLDYRHAPAGKTMWPVSQDVAVEDSSGALWEVPIASKPGRRYQQLTPARLKAKFSRNVPKEQQSRMVGQLGLRKNPANVLKLLAQRVPIKFDFHNLSPRRLAAWIADVPAPADGSLDVVVLIGHSKEHINDSAFDALLRRLTENAGIRIVGFSEIAARLPALRSPGAADLVHRTPAVSA